MDSQEVTFQPYNPTDAEKATLQYVKGEVEEMMQLRDKTWPQFNDRTLKDFLNDNHLRLNTTILPNSAVDKEEWQSNTALPTIRNGVKKMIAGFALNVPDMNFEARGEDNMLNLPRADIAKNLVYGSYMADENPVITNFWEAWQNAADGTIIEYEGYLKTRMTQKFITKYDIVEGQIEWEEKEVDIDDRCIAVQLPLLEFFVKNWYEPDVQNQDAIAWVQTLSWDRFWYGWQKYKNAKFVRNKSSLTRADSSSVFYDQWWFQRLTGKTDVELIRYYNKLRDRYVVIANGVVLLDAPLIWSYNGMKVYPFAKTICEPFTGKYFFYGKSLVDILMPLYDILNTLFNSVLDKEFRSTVPLTLIGRVNADAFDLEDEIITGDSKVIVEDVSQVKQWASESITAADAEMIRMVSGGIDEASPSLPSLLSGRNATAREVVIAEEKLREIKSIYSEFMNDLWRQKGQLRLANISMNYPQPRMIAEENERGQIVEKKIYQTYIINNVVLDRETGERGMLEVQFREFKPGEVRKLQAEASIKEAAMQKMGINYKVQFAKPDFFTGFRYKIDVVEATLHKTSLAKLQTAVVEKLGGMSQYFPQILAANQKEMFEQFMQAYDDDPAMYLKRFDAISQMAAQQAPGGQGGIDVPPGDGSPVEGQISGQGAPTGADQPQPTAEIPNQAAGQEGATA